MQTGIIDLWIRTRESYWFIPGLLSLSAFVAALALVRIDYLLGDAWLEQFDWLLIKQAESAQALLSTIAGSMITVAGVTFSMTLLAVSHATAQFGAHLLIAFMRDRANQFTLGIFIATFIYCLTVLRSVSSSAQAGSETTGEFIPHIAVNTALALAALSVCVLIFFIHHVPQSINVTQVIANVGDELIKCIRAIYPQQKDSEDDRTVEPARPESAPQVIAAPDPCGYLRIVELEALVRETSQEDLIVELRKRPGDFALPGEPLMSIWGKESISEATQQRLQSCCSWGSERTTSQDVLLPVQQLLEIIGRALSPSVNNQYIALLCIDQLGRGISELSSRVIPAAGKHDEQGELRVIAPAIDHELFLQSLTRPLEQYVHDDAIACRRVCELFGRISELPGSGESRQQLSKIRSRFERYLESAAVEAS